VFNYSGARSSPSVVKKVCVQCGYMRGEAKEATRSRWSPAVETKNTRHEEETEAIQPRRRRGGGRENLSVFQAKTVYLGSTNNGKDQQKKFELLVTPEDALRKSSIGSRGELRIMAGRQPSLKKSVGVDACAVDFGLEKKVV